MTTCQGKHALEHSPAGVACSELAAPSRGRRCYAPSQAACSECFAQTGDNESSSLPVLLGKRCNVFVIDEVSDLVRADDTRKDMALADFTAEYVSNWLNSVVNGLPSPLLSSLKAHIMKNRIDGVAFQDILDQGSFGALAVEGFSPVHLNRLRKAWFLDHPRSSESESDAPDAVASVEYVSSWLNSVTNALPSTVLDNLKQHIVKHQIDCSIFQDILDRCCFSSLEVEGLTPAHMNRLRKAWYLDHPKTSSSEPEFPDGVETMGSPEASPESNTMVSKSSPELIAAVINRLAEWAGFDRNAALVEVQHLLSETMHEDVGASISSLVSVQP